MFCDTLIIVLDCIKVAHTPINAITASPAARLAILSPVLIPVSPRLFIIGLSIYVPARFAPALISTQPIAKNTFDLSSPT